ncbi:MAG: twin-arginine translocase TatA/TatE family subunit [Campylobacterota bacterium]|nr:twin-arginine translocase TatA/TatE family subunit [Campylobacterota bacterium]
MGMPSGIELFIIVAVVVLLFGGKKIPELMKGMGKGIKEFKGAIKDDEQTDMTTNDKKIEEDTVKTTTADTSTEAPASTTSETTTKTTV